MKCPQCNKSLTQVLPAKKGQPTSNMGYLRKILENPPVVRHRANHHPEILAEFQKLVEVRNLGEAAPPTASAE